MIKRISERDFINEFKAYGRDVDFSLAGLRALYEFLEEVNPEWELDVISVCCDFSELTIEEALKETGAESLEELQNETIVLEIDDETIIYQAY